MFQHLAANKAKRESSCCTAHLQEISSLQHEAFDDSMKYTIFVASRLTVLSAWLLRLSVACVHFEHAGSN